MSLKGTLGQCTLKRKAPFVGFRIHQLSPLHRGKTLTISTKKKRVPRYDLKRDRILRFLFWSSEACGNATLLLLYPDSL